ncbi:pecanex-like protein 1 [Saccostrea echinata]|uniref:pecanex-like protein 1 n=1 Tax=Saccostrea echinata TaxID=191078 RepID=UPI002A7FD876|nr:pecanex-like protein 1 [Saccostrea echinata]
MGSHIFDILRQGIWASVTGGWFFDPYQNIFSNTFHLYVWMGLLVFPFILYLTLESSLIVWTIYCATIGVFFTVIKLVNFKLHHIFDTSEVIEDTPKGDKSEDKDSHVIELCNNANEPEHIEMVKLHHSSSRQLDSDNNNSDRIISHSSVEIRSGSAPLAELENDDIDQKPTKQRESTPPSSDSIVEGKLDVERGCHPHQVTLKAEVEVNRELSDGEMEIGEVKLPPKKEDTDSDLSPDGGLRIRKRRKAVRRSKSALDYSPDSPVPRAARAFEKLDRSLPANLYTQVEMEKESEEAASSKNGQGDVELEDLEGMDEGRVSPYKQRVPSNKASQRLQKYRRSYSADEGVPPRPTTPPLREVFDSGLRNRSRTESKEKSSNNSCEPFPELVKFHAPDILADLPGGSGDKISRTPKVSDSDRSDISVGEINVQVKTRDRTPNKKDRPSSAGDINRISTGVSLDPSLTTKSASKSTRSGGIGSKIVKFFQNGGHSNSQEIASEQSSTVGLECLFSTDSDSTEDDSSHPKDHYLTDSSSSMTNEGESTFDTSPEHPPMQSRLSAKEKSNPYEGSDIAPNNPSETDQASSGLNVLMVAEHQDIPPPMDPPMEDKELQILKQQGAIPKNYRRSQTGQCTEVVPSLLSSQDQAGSPSSGELSDTEDFRRKILEILSDSTDNPDRMKKLFKAVIEAKDRRGSNDSPGQGGSQRKKEEKTEEGEIARPTPGDDQEAQSSKSTTPTECCALLPVSKEIEPAQTQSTKLNRKRGRRRRGNRSLVRRDTPTIKPPAGSSIHSAKDHNDTSEGAVHWFQDENGQWFGYTFEENSAGVAFVAEDLPAHMDNMLDKSWTSSDGSGNDDSGSTVILDSPSGAKKDDASLDPLNPNMAAFDIPNLIRNHDMQLLQQNLMLRLPCDSSDESDSPTFPKTKEKKPKHFYKFQIFKKTFLKIRFDRLALLALLDRNLSVIENLITVLIAIMVGALGALVLTRNFYHDIWVFVFCFIIAGCQYSLLKSVQPDAASPMHGYNRLVVFSRPFYFSVCCGLMLLLDYTIPYAPTKPTTVYGLPFGSEDSLTFAKDLLKILVLCLPIIFTIGLLPQVNTFIMYLMEQIDMHIFGGNGSISLTSSVYSVIRSIIGVAFVYGFCFVAIEAGGPAVCDNRDLSQNVVFSVFSAILVAVSYHLSRSASDPSVLWMLIRDSIWDKEAPESAEEELIDPLPEKLKQCVSERLQSDLLVSVFILIIVFAVHVSTVFSSPVLQPVLSDILYYIAAGFGFLVHYLIPMLRKEMPWLCCSHPLLSNRERNMFEVTVAPEIMWFEKMYVWLRFFERNVMYPAVILCALTQSTANIICKFGIYVGPVILVVCAMKLLRFAFCNTSKQYLIITFTVLFFKYDYRKASETFLIDYFIVSILLSKFCDLMLKMKFIITYIAPWQITWGSAFHAFAQPFSVPHSAMLFVQAAVSSFFSTPLNPFLGSAIFITSYVRPIKFWEKDYNTKRVDHSNTRLSSQLDCNPGADDNNLNSIFYEHLTRSLQHSLCGDLMLGRWGNVEQGDCFIMASDYLNALVHITEMGNGLVTFQLRGLEFRGTYCQQREVEAITEGVKDNEGFCCCEPGHLPHFLSLNAAFNQRWLAWEVVVTKYILEGYSISDNSAATMVQGFDARRILLNYYIMSIIYYTVRSPRLDTWLTNEAILETLQATEGEDFVDVDPIFTQPTDDDYDPKLKGVSRNKFCSVFLDWIQYCASRRDKSIDSGKNSPLVSLSLCLGLLGRRALGTAAHNNTTAAGAEFFLYGLHALFKGDFRITSPHDEWVFADMELLRRVVAPAIRMALKLHQDYYLFTDEYEDHETLYNAISNYEQTLVISHEADPQWRNAVLSNTPSLLALRHVFADTEISDKYKIIMLNKKFLSFRVVKVNRECVRGLWAGQQQELIYLRNRNPERGSIQNAKQALRNMINSSCDQPIGYPIYVSPLTTSYSSTHNQLSSIIGGEFILANVKKFFKNTWVRMRRRCGATCTGGSASCPDDLPYTVACSHTGAAMTLGTRSVLSTPTNQQEIGLQTLGNRGSLVSTASSASKPNALVTLAGFITETTTNKETLTHKVRIMDTNYVFENINLGRRIDVQWPNEEWKQSGGKNGWNGWMPTKGMEGTVVHKWVPCHRETLKRSHIDKVIYLVQISDKYVPISEQGVLDLGAEV